MRLRAKAACHRVRAMPEFPDISVYLEALETRVMRRKLERLRIINPFVLRTAMPPITALEQKRVVALRRLGKRIVFGFEGDLWLVLHLMIAGRLQWVDGSTKPDRGRHGLAVFLFENGTLTLTE